MEKKRCPCEFIEVDPCKEACSCRNSAMSGGCYRCATYGSYEQQVKAAKYIAMALRSAEPLLVQIDKLIRDRDEWKRRCIDMTASGGRAHEGYEILSKEVKKLKEQIDSLRHEEDKRHSCPRCGAPGMLICMGCGKAVTKGSCDCPAGHTYACSKDCWKGKK